MRSYVPSSARPKLSTAGVAEPRMTAAPASSPRRIATSRAWSRGVRSLLYAASCSSSTTITPMSASGATTASRVPTTMSTSPARIRRHSSARSPSPSPEWTRATRASRSARKPVDEGHRERDLGDEDERRTPGFE
jgi:hypothetical protein